jgi:hypothetical protein
MYNGQFQKAITLWKIIEREPADNVHISSW